MLYEQKKSIYKRLNYIVNVFNVSENALNIIHSYGEIVRKFDTLRLRF